MAFFPVQAECGAVGFLAERAFPHRTPLLPEYSGKLPGFPSAGSFLTWETYYNEWVRFVRMLWKYRKVKWSVSGLIHSIFFINCQIYANSLTLIITICSSYEGLYFCHPKAVPQ